MMSLPELERRLYIEGMTEYAAAVDAAILEIKDLKSAIQELEKELEKERAHRDQLVEIHGHPEWMWD